MEEYGYYQDRGVKGKTSTYPEIAKFGTLAKFGSGKGKKGGLTEGIKNWVQRKNTTHHFLIQPKDHLLTS